MNNKIRIHQMLHISLMVAVIAILAQIMFYIGTIPLTLQTCGIMLAILILRPKEAGLSLLIYVLLGTVGVPIFAGFKGGLGTLLGPTGGFLIGFIPGAWLGTIVYQKMKRSFWGAIVAVIVSLLFSYTFGLLWFMNVMHCGIWAGLTGAVFPYLPFEVIKMAIFVPVGRQVQKSLGQQFPEYFS